MPHFSSFVWQSVLSLNKPCILINIICIMFVICLGQHPIKTNIGFLFTSILSCQPGVKNFIHLTFLPDNFKPNFQNRTKAPTEHSLSIAKNGLFSTIKLWFSMKCWCWRRENKLFLHSCVCILRLLNYIELCSHSLQYYLPNHAKQVNCDK